MKKLSFWAHRHPGHARLAIVFALLTVNGLAILTGWLLRQMDVSLPLSLLLTGAGLYAYSLIAYPYKRGRGARYYWKQKRMDIGLATASFLMVIYMGNRPEMLFQYSTPFSSALATLPYSTGDSLTKKTYKSPSEFNASIRDENGKLLKWKERKKLLKEQVRAIKNTSGLSRKDQVGLIILSVIVAIGLIILIGALSCSIACGGSGVLAVIVAVGGVALIIFLLLRIIRKLSRREPPTPVEKEGGQKVT